MINLAKIQDLESVVSLNGELLDLDVEVVVDNRELNSTSLYLCFIGNKYNPLLHLDKVKNSGCRYIVVEEGNDFDSDGLVVIIVNSLETFCAELAKEIAVNFQQRGGKIIVISGSNGKTTTRSMTAHILSELIDHDRVVETQKNNNNHLGVPFTVFQIRNNTKYAVIEFGSNHPGEIKFLCEMLSPDIGYTTNIGDSHLEFFGNRENVLLEESLIKDYVRDKFFLNIDDELLESLPRKKNFLELGVEAKNYPIKVGHDSLSWCDIVIKNEKLTGKHNYSNLAAACSLVSYFGYESDDIRKAAQSFMPTKNRSEWIKFKKLDVFLDAYNANPSSMRAAVDGFLASMQQKNVDLSRCCAVVGDMNELGDAAPALHHEIGQYIVSQGIGHIIFVGRFADDYVDTESENIKKFLNAAAAKDYIEQLPSSYKYMFIKGSRSLQLESIIDIR